MYRIRGYEFVLPSTYAETPIIITMEYLNAKMDRIKGRLYANHYGDYKPVFLNEFTIEGVECKTTKIVKLRMHSTTLYSRRIRPSVCKIGLNCL